MKCIQVVALLVAVATLANANCSPGRLDVAINQYSEEQTDGGRIILGSDDLELGYGQIIGLRWNALKIPQGAKITKAMVWFTSDNTDNVHPVTLRINAHNSISPASLGSAHRDVSKRPKSSQSVKWVVDKWWPNQRGNAQRSPDLSHVIQPLVSNRNWRSTGNPVVLIFAQDSSDRSRNIRDAKSGKNGGAPKFWLEWTCPATTTTTKPTTAAPPPPPTCGDKCNSDANCNRASNNCRKCRDVFPGFGKTCAHPATTTTTKKPTTAAPPPPPTCGDTCTTDASCNRATNNCRKCRTVFPGFPKVCAPAATTTTTKKPTTAAPPPPPTCGTRCNNDGGCPNTGCKTCRAAFPGTFKICLPPVATTTTKKPTTAPPPPPPTCGDTCTTDASCNRASNSCRKCRTVFPGFPKVCAQPATTTKSPTTAAPPPRGCGSSCASDAQCRYVGASSKCNSCQQLFPNGPKICIPPPPAPVTCPTAKPCEPVCPKMPKTRCRKDCKAAGMKYGTTYNANGCEICKCQPSEPTCPKFGEIKCRKECKASGQDWEKVVDASGCEICACVPKCEAFKQRKCNLDCKAQGMVWGMEKDANGCDTCKCEVPQY